MITESKLKNPNYTYEDVITKMQTGSEVIAKVLRFDVNTKLVSCSLGKNLNAIIHVENFAPVLKKGTKSAKLYYPEIAQCVGKCVVTYVVNKPRFPGAPFILSRKDCIIENFEKLKKQEFIKCEITAITDRVLYVDCGVGVHGMIHISEATSAIVRTIKDCDFEVGQIITAKVVYANSDIYSLVLSYTQAEKTKYKVGDIVFGKVREKLYNSFDGEESFYVELLPSHKSAILNTNTGNNLSYNDYISASIVYADSEKDRYKLKKITL